MVGGGYTDHAGPEFAVFLCIALAYSRQKANVNAGPASALDSMGAKRSFGCNILNIGLK